MTNTTTQPMSKEAWIDAATAKLLPYEGGKARDYAESLYQTFVIEDGDHWANDPEGAVAEDMSYWED